MERTSERNLRVRTNRHEKRHVLSRAAWQLGLLHSGR
jgi:hypothetical protein